MNSADLVRRLGDKVYGLLVKRGWPPLTPAVVNAARARLEADPAFYSVEVDEQYEQGLMYLPSALDILMQMQSDYAFVAECLCGFLKTWKEWLRADDLLADTLSCVAAAFRVWNCHFSPTELAANEHAEPIYEAGAFAPAPSDILLDCLMSAKIAEDGADFFDRVFSEWMHDTRSAESSANVLDFALRVRLKPGWLKLYRSTSVLTLVFDSALLERHWSVARPLLEKVTSGAYCSAIKSFLIA